MLELSVPHIQQIEDGYCLPACVEMVLAFYGIQRSHERDNYYTTIRRK